MTGEEITENNKMIALFMGYKYHPHPEKDCGWRKEDGRSKLHGRNYYLCRKHCDLRYYNSYEWIMEVVDRIETMEYMQSNTMSFMPMFFSVTIERNFVVANIGNSPIKETYSRKENKIKSIYNCVVEFIKWHNGSKKS